MENSWQSKCGSFWQQSQSPPSVMASSLLDSHTQESMLLTSGMIHEHMLSNMHGLDNLGHAGLGASFLSLVSGPSSHVPGDEQHQLDPKPVSGTNLVSSNCRTADEFCGGSKVSVIPGAFLPNLTARDAFYPLTSSNANVYCSNSSAVLQATNLNFQKSQAVACHNIHEKDKAKGSSSQIGNNNTNSVSANSWKLLKYAHTTSLHVENNISAYHHGFNPSSSSLRVFCSGTSGNLLLSDAGLLGVVCTCHGLYMSISKFSEHSGSCDVNPGYAVCMDNGQTLAHWWKTFFSKTGIRVLEGQSGWDWPEGISFASGLTNHPIASISNSPALLNQVSPLKASVSRGQQKFSMLNSKENQSCRNIVDKNTIFERDRTSQECSNSIFKYFMNSSHGNLQHAASQPQCGLPNLFTVHTERASQSSTDKLDFICGGSANSLPALPNTQNLNTPCNSRSVGTETSFIVNRPGVSSNIELRLGQPRGQIQTLETKFQPAFVSELNGMHAKSPKVFFPDKLLQKTGNELQGSGWNLQYADIASCTPERRGSTQLGHSCNVGGAYGAKTDCQKDPLSVSLEMTNANSLLLSCFKNPGTKEQSITAINSNVSEKLHCKSYASGSEKICHPWSSVAATFNGFSMNVTNAKINVNKGKKVEYSLNGLLGAVKSNTEFSEAFKEDKRNFNLVSGETSSNYSSTFHEKSLKSELMPAMVVDESYGRHILNSCSKISSLSNIMHFNHDRVKHIQNSAPSKETPMGFSSKNSVFVRNATPTLLKERPCGIKKGLHYENVEVPSVWNMLERSNGENGPASLRSLQECETIKNPYVRSPLNIVPSISKDHSNLLDSSRMPKIPEFGERPTLSGTICWMGHDSKGFGTVTGGSMHAEDPNLSPVEQLFVRPRGPECNFTRCKKEHGSQGLPYTFVPEKCSSAAQENCLEGKQVLIGENCCNLVKQGDRNGADTNLLHSKLKENWKDIAKSFEKTESSVTTDIKNSEFRSFQWRDVPKKIMDSCGSTRKDQQVGSYNRPVPAIDVSKCFAGFALNVVPLKEQEISNISSGSSAPDVAQSSIEVSKNDSSTVEGGNIKATNNFVLDEGSGNDRSWSADGALDNECTDFFGSASCINLTKREPSKVFPRKRSLSLIEEIRLQNSLRSKSSPYKLKRSSAIQEESDCLPKFELGPTKRRKTVKWMKLDIPVVSGQSSINNGSPKCTEEVEQRSHSFWEMQMPDRSDQRSLGICADAIVQSSKQRKSAFSAATGISQRNFLHKVYYQLEQQTTDAHKSSVDNDTLSGSVILSKKRLRLDNASAPCKEVQEVCCELTAKLTSLGDLSNSLGKPKFFKWMTRPTVFGKYGIISNGNPSKPAKIISLRKILENVSSHSAKSNRNAENNEKLISTSVKVKKMSVRHVKETILSKKDLKSQVTKGGTENLHPIESECCGRNRDIEIASCSTTNGSDDLSYTLQKCNNHGITERKPGVQLKTKFKEGRKRSLHELLTKGNGFKVVNSSVSCQTASRCGEFMEMAVKGRAQRNEMNNAMRCSEKHQPEYSDMFCCVCGGSNKDGCSPLLQCNRFLMKGLRNEAEAVDPEKVSLCGRCMPCAISQDSDGESLQPGEKFLTCARTEGYKGRKREGFLHNCTQDTDGNGGCLVPQEQLNAWLHIHRQKPHRKGHPALSTSNVESDCRKAYARYKQSKSWKHLVVYKSRIHALGLYTSQFISRGAMVVEYVGEIVGLRVADRREKEYHSGKKIQHKSACYFFRIDKEHIIDATRKGGIARFVNHSCQPNCAAKVISVRTGKKVVFFAERDVYPGEEITYDYHFNHEDEGQKIPCYCNSKNCRRYLN